MNNSESTTLVQSKSVFATQQSNVRPFLRNSAIDGSLNESRVLPHRGSADEVTQLRYPTAITIEEVTDVQKVRVSTQNVTHPLDRGLWLLSSSTTRHERWDGICRIPAYGADLDQFTISKSVGAAKRVCDIAGSLFLLCIVLPLIPLIVLAIKLDSPGPVFFRHSRVGKNGKYFKLWKFRSMRVDVSPYGHSPQNVRDARLTRVGRLIRRLSIDEIPQLINVLRGEMSLVGPRPEMPFLVELFHEVNNRRLSVAPGITGLWQISPARAFPIHENPQYDLHYVRNQNLVLDCMIILRTVAAVIHGVGAI